MMSRAYQPEAHRLSAARSSRSRASEAMTGIRTINRACESGVTAGARRDKGSRSAAPRNRAADEPGAYRLVSILGDWRDHVLIEGRAGARQPLWGWSAASLHSQQVTWLLPSGVRGRT